MLKVKDILVKSVCRVNERHRVQCGFSVILEFRARLAGSNSAATMATKREDVRKWKIYLFCRLLCKTASSTVCISA